MYFRLITPVFLLSVALLMLGGVILWHRGRSPATALVAGGFAVYGIAELVRIWSGAYLVIGADSIYSLSATTYYVATAGQWAAGAGLFWHARSRGS